MRKATLFVSFYRNNRVFDVTDPEANRDDSRRFHYDIREQFAKFDYDLSTQDINPPEESEFVLYHDMPKEKLIGKDRTKSFLMIMEPPTVKPRAWDSANHRLFSRIFTYSDTLVREDKANPKKYIKINYAQKFSKEVGFEIGKRPKLLTTIIGNKTSKHPSELYTSRLDVIRWFESHRAESFEFFGSGWEDYRMPVQGWQGAILRKKLALTTYRGMVGSKFDTLKNYQFAISFENCRGVDGYISEKIFDCMVAGTIPIYYGASNVDEHIPSNCFIDYRQFASIEQMYTALVSMSDHQIADYQHAIADSLTGPKIETFQSQKVAFDIVDGVFSALNSDP